MPITWATNLISRMGVNAPKEQMIVPKDHKDVISAMQKYKKDLENQKTCGDNRLPSFYQKVSHRLNDFLTHITIEFQYDIFGLFFYQYLIL